MDDVVRRDPTRARSRSRPRSRPSLSRATPRHGLTRASARPRPPRARSPTRRPLSRDSNQRRESAFSIHVRRASRVPAVAVAIDRSIDRPMSIGASRSISVRSIDEYRFHSIGDADARMVHALKPSIDRVDRVDRSIGVVQSVRWVGSGRVDPDGNHPPPLSCGTRARRGWNPARSRSWRFSRWRG